MDIEALQRQLKAAIQNHQVLVGRMKSEPQNAILQKQLRELQSQITILSDKQKSYVQQLRKELVSTGSSCLVASQSDGSKPAGIQTIGMSPGVRYSLRPAPGGGMTLMPSGAVAAPISATISVASNSTVMSVGGANVISNGIQSFSVVNPSLHTPVQNVLSLMHTSAGAVLSPSIVNSSSSTLGAIARPLVIKSSFPNNVGTQLFVNSSPGPASISPGVNLSFPQSLVSQRNSLTTTPTSHVATQQLAILLPKQERTGALPSLATSTTHPVVLRPTPTRSVSPLIRVPQFSPGRPNILQAKTTTSVSSPAVPSASVVSQSVLSSRPSVSVSGSEVGLKGSQESVVTGDIAAKDAGARKLTHSPIPTSPKIGVDSPSKKKRKSPHALIRDDPLAHVEASTRFLIPHKSTAVTKLDFITTPSSKVPISEKTVVRPQSPVTSASSEDASNGSSSSVTSDAPADASKDSPQSRVVDEALEYDRSGGSEASLEKVDVGDKEKDATKDAAKDSAIVFAKESAKDPLEVETASGKDAKIDEVGTKKVASKGPNVSSTSCPPAIVTRNKAQVKKETKIGSQSACPKKIDLPRKSKKENQNLEQKVGAELPSASASNAKDNVSTATVNREKVEFMNALDLVLPSVLKELQNKRSERKRRSTANPHFSYPGGGNSNASGWGDLSNANSKRARLHQAMLAAATAAAEVEAASASASSSGTTPVAAASPPRGNISRGKGAASDTTPTGGGENAAAKRGGESSPAPNEASSPRGGKIKGKTPPSLKRKSMMAGDRHRRDDVEEEADESRPESPASDVSSESSNNAKNGAFQVPSPDFHEDACHACSLSTPPLFPCSSCSLVFHPSCLVPPMKTPTPPTPDWRCQHCQPSTPTSAANATNATPSSPGALGKKIVKKKKKSAKKNGTPDGHEKDVPEKSVSGSSTPVKMVEEPQESRVTEPSPVKMDMDESESNGGGEATNYSATLNIMHSYIASKSSKEEEKRKLQRRNAELKAEREQLETKSHQLKYNMQAQNDQHELLVTAHETIQGQVEKLKNFLKLFQTY